ncbi:histidine kinase [Streptomyces sp. TRM68367]|uniref:sensor histidine kinase n=1 Tax=Streptomyces sp. TRM68367 TaxID=2758415 RepID=UPI00165B1BA2|nr:histidine kinase [Streptomyces sp. TRM68367]MBC9730360.1 sensor histidine kinase [Streptomyces sp. TRM68367]
MFGRLRGWQRRQWRERGKAERVELTTLVTWYVTTWAFFIPWLALPLAAQLWNGPRALVLGGPLLLVGILQCVVANRLTRPALDHYLGRGTLPGRALAPSIVLLVLALALVLALRATGGADPLVARLSLGAVLTVFGLVYALVVPWRTFLLQSAGAGAVLAAAFTLAGDEATEAIVVGLLVAFWAAISLFTSRCAAWTLSVLWEAERARDVEAQLAIAEERLRFGRDLHDVIGRNMAVIALKSELAVQLSQRGRPEAVEQMIEVQRLAQESQREVREVVRGYREADLGAELAGAQGVLSAAGIDCTVTAPSAGLPAAVQSALGWVVREAATNVLRHGDARRCSVVVRVAEGLVVLIVENDGVPRDAGSGPGGGSGLAGLRERLAGIGGTLRAGPAGDGLFRLTVEVPLPSRVGRDLSEVTS